MLRVYVHQFEGAEDLRALPLAAGLLVATAARALGDRVQASIVRARRPLDAVTEGYDAPDVLAYACYTWNVRYTLEASRRAAARWPDARIVLGGPSIPRGVDELEALAEANPHVDAFALGEGELTFVALLEAVLDGRGLESVAGLALPVSEGGGVVLTEARPRMASLAQSASPYLSGLFDDLDRSKVNAAVVETNRGCPFSCTFCDWGQATGSRVYELPIERVKAELDWVGERGIPFLYIIDANFGIRPRDQEIVEHLATVKARTGFPAFCYFHLTKNAHVRNLRTVERLQEAGIGCRMALSMQDFDPVVLEAIERKNIKLERALHLRELCHARGIPTFNELLLGLPGQTLASFCASMVKAMTPFEADTFSLYLARLLENAAMASAEHRARYGLQTSWVVATSPEASYTAYVDELEEIVVGTDAMPPDDWARAYRFGYLLSVCYNQGLLRDALVRLRFEREADVAEVVEALDAVLDAMHSAPATSLLGRVEAIFARYIRAIRSGDPMLLPLDGMGPRRWTIEEAIALTLQPHREAFARHIEGLWHALERAPRRHEHTSQPSALPDDAAPTP